MTPKPNFAELRRQLRLRKKTRAAVYWDSGHGIEFTHGECLDVSESGLRLQLMARIPRGSYVHVSLDALEFGAFGTVRHSDQRGTIGVELRSETLDEAQATRWKTFVQALEASSKPPQA